MKKLVLGLSLFLSCCIVEPLCYEYKWKHGIDVKTRKEAMAWCSENIEYKSDKDDYWQTPKETYCDETGDCEDYCILFMQLVFELGHNPKLTVIKTKDGTHHAIVRIENNYYDIQPNKKYKSLEDVKDFEQLWESFDYSTTMYYAVTYHGNPAKLKK